MTQEQMTQNLIDSIGNHSELFGGIMIGIMLSFIAMFTLAFVGGFFDVLVYFFRKKIKQKYGDK